MAMEIKDLENATKAAEHDVSDADKILAEMPVKTDYSPENYKAMEHDFSDAGETRIDPKETLEGIEEAAVETYKSIEDATVGTYKSIEKGVVGTYKKIEDAVVGAYQKVEDSFVEKYLAKPGETVEEAKKRVSEKNTQK